MLLNFGHLVSALVPVTAVAAQATNQAFEPTNFSVTEALEQNGIDVSAILPLAGLANNLTQRSSDNQSCAAACSALRSIYGSTHVLSQSSAAYENFTEGYWSNFQTEVDPYCIFEPSDSVSVAVAVLISRLTKCPFAVKSGGHAPFRGASNVPGGVTISLDNLKSITVSTDKTIASVGPGNTWGLVYDGLASQDLAIIGGRVYDVGVGGLTTGGGISFFSNIYGWACDNVASYEVVTASGVIVTASPTQFPDLYFGLRGGGNNMGIVTQFNFETISVPGSLIWGGAITYVQDFDAAVHAFTEMSQNSDQDRNAGQWLTWLYYGGTQLATAELYYAKPNAANASIFANYKAIPSISDTTKNQTLSAFAESVSVDTPRGNRQTFYVMTTKNDEELNSIAKDLYFEQVLTVANITGSYAAFVYQSITVPQIEQMAKNGGNPLGLSPEDGPLTLMLLNPTWTNAEDDEAYFTFCSNLFKSIKSEAVARGLASNYLYMNYAAQYQDPISSYNATNKQKLIDIADKYDPTKVFQILQPGYFKLDNGPPVPGTDFFDY